MIFANLLFIICRDSPGHIILNSILAYKLSQNYHTHSVSTTPDVDSDKRIPLDIMNHTSISKLQLNIFSEFLWATQNQDIQINDLFS